ncbi:hypothetical protein, partial [Actinomycetospora sp.]|uniref:hypothetical protein n=1 Tax=Actinomycetospora sp. TaxID=1872135 RepID=UPI002F406924
MPVPGDPDAVEEACRQLTAAATAVQAAGESIAGHGRAATADWTGLAAPLALARTQQDATGARRVAEAANTSVGPLARFAEELRAAQQDYARGEEMAAQGRAATSGGPEAAPAADVARDRAEQAMHDGASLMRAAEERAHVANEAAARGLDAATSSLAGIAPPPPAAPAAATSASVAEMGNVAASLGYAVFEHPVDGWAVLGGGALAAVSAAGGLASVVLTATGGGAVAGVPGGALSAAGVATGVGIAGAGLLDLASHAAGDSAVAPFQVDQQREPVQGPAPFPPPSGISGKTRHGEEQAESRNGGHGVSDEAMEDAVANPVKPQEYRPGDNTYR